MLKILTEKEITVSSQTARINAAEGSVRLCYKEAADKSSQSPQLLPPEGEAGGRRREAKNLEPSGVDSGRAVQLEPEQRTKPSSSGDLQDPEIQRQLEELSEAVLKEEEQWDPQEQKNKKLTICPLRQNQIYLRSEAQRIYNSVGGLCRGLCRAKLTEALKHHLSQRQTQHAANLEDQAEVEADGKRLCDDVEGQRPWRKHSPLSGERPQEGTLDVPGTGLEEREENQKQHLPERIPSLPYEQIGDPASAEEGDESSWSQKVQLSEQISGICEIS